MPNNVLKRFQPAVAQWFVDSFAAPSPPQEMGWPQIAAGKHTLILAPTGSGKTLAAFLWCINDVLCRETNSFGGVDGVHTLYISPLKALNNDIHCNLQAPLKGIRRYAVSQGENLPELRTMVRTGDTPSHVRQAMLKKPPHILITTPESLYLLLTSERGRKIFSGLRYIILDEIHALCNSKRGVHLSLSLERLMPLCRQNPVRIGLSATQKPLQRIAAFLGGQIFSDSRERPQQRPVQIVDCGQRKDLDLQVISPVASFSDLPESSVWPAVIDRLYALIISHDTTLIFANMRTQTERIARLLNEKHQEISGQNDEVLALAHHGSISRESRYVIEARLKAGEIPAVVATASLELGIDIGSIDLVVQLEAPRNVSTALQRVGRSGHLLGATSKGRIMPLYASDLDDAVAMANFMQQSDIEETQVSENCLDVLAQQITAEVAMRDWQREALFRLFTQSYCYRNLSVAAFNQVLEMLAGRFADAPLRNLKPRISWDRVNDKIIGLRGSKLLACMNGGTIPDRGYFAVYLADSKVRLGEMDEEFVFESRVGHVFFLGNNEWRIEEIRQDRILVTPVRAIKPRAPFWKGDRLYRDFQTSQNIGAFRRQLLTDLNDKLLPFDTLFSDRDSVTNLRAYLQRQQDATGKVPTDKTLVVEQFLDGTGEPHFILHTCLGARVNGLWAMALAAFLEKQHGVEVQYTYDDDALLLRIPDTNEPFSVEQLLRKPANEVENLLIDALFDAPIFAVRFRHNAARALLLTRSQPNKRIPLWLQRLRAADLLQIVRQYPDFPILIETFRDCLQEVFDLEALKQVLELLRSGELHVHVVHTVSPSPMASGLMFDFLSENLYEADRSRLPGQIAKLSSALLADILNREEIPAIVTTELIREAEARWQHQHPSVQAKDAESLFTVIEKMAPISTDALQSRAIGSTKAWLRQLVKTRRILEIVSGWIPAHEQALFQLEHPEILQSARPETCERIRRFLRVHGPVLLSELARALSIPENVTAEILQDLRKEKEVVFGPLILDDPGEYWCDRHNFTELYRRAVSQRRDFARAANRKELFAFLLKWHAVAVPGQSLDALLQRYTGFRLPLAIFERELLRSRLAAGNPAELAEKVEALEQLISKGDFVVRAFNDGESGRVNVDFIARGSGNMFEQKKALMQRADDLVEPAASVFSFLKENGASLMRDIEVGSGLTAFQTRQALTALAKAGLATTDAFRVFVSILQSEAEQPAPANDASWLPDAPPKWAQSSRSHQRRKRLVRAAVREQVLHADSRWFLLDSFAVLGKPVSEQEQAERQAGLLLRRHGILAKEHYRREQGLLPWFEIFKVLRRLEWQGEIRRGYFVEGLSGMQFALPEALTLLQKTQSQSGRSAATPVLLSSMDPALPFGSGFDWALQDTQDEKIRVVRGAGNHFVFLGSTPVFYSENYATRLWQLSQLPHTDIDSCVDIFKSFLQLPALFRPRKKIEIHEINRQAAAENELSKVFLRRGFEIAAKKLVLWPSGLSRISSE